MKRILSGVCFIMLALIASNIFAADLRIKQFQAGDVISAADVNNNFKALAEAVQQLQKQGIELQKQVTELQKQNKALIEENRALKNSLASIQTKAAEPEKQASTAASTSSSKTPKYRLRSKPKTFSENEAKKIFEADLRQNIENDFGAQGDVVIDSATGLMWQKAGSDNINYARAQEYIQQLNYKKFAGHKDWRLPTIDELTSLMEDQPMEGLYLNPIFNVKQRCYWSSDTLSSEIVLSVSFINAQVTWDRTSSNNYVRAVRSLQP